MRQFSVARSRLWLLVLAAACVLAGSVAATSASAAYPVKYTIAHVLSLDPDVAPPGANHWDCHPTAAHPRPVILVHGLTANQHSNWGTLSPLLANNGYCVFTLNYGGPPLLGFSYGYGAMEDSAAELGEFVDRVRAATGAATVDLVGASEGATMPHYYLKFLRGDAKVTRFVGLVPAVKGTSLFGLSALVQFLGIDGLVAATVSPAAKELLAGSSFLRNLNAGGLTMPSVKYTSIVTIYDEAVTPYRNGQLPAGPNVTNVTLQRACPVDFAEHIGTSFDPNALRLVLNALDPAHAKSSCRFVPTVF